MDLTPSNKNLLLQERRKAIFTQQKDLAPLSKTALFTAEMDTLLSTAYTTRLEKTEIDKHVCLIALGGYGRGELCPYSDIDLLILHSGEADKEKISAAVRFFWDMGLNLGLVVRSLHECAKILGEDIASDTALLQTRFLAGNKRLFQHAKTSVIKPYFTKSKKQFVELMQKTISDGIFSPDNTLFRTEPNIKDGICALRDCQRIIWAERVISGAKSMSDLYHLSHYKQADIETFSAAYEFLTAIRIELHMLCGKRMDTLESSLQADIAQSLGFGDNNPAPLMEEYFKTVRAVKNFGLIFLEKRHSSRGFWTKLRTRVGTVNLKNGVQLLDGFFFVQIQNYPDKTHAPVWILQVFKLAIIYKATLSVELINWIRTIMHELPKSDFKVQAVDDLFLEILSQEKDAGKILLIMHDCGVLTGVIPAFEALTCKVEYDSYHEYTVDQHLLLALVAFDELDRDEDERIRSIYKNLNDKRLLRLAILLHDIGKGMEGDHVANGTIITEEICDRLGLLESEKQSVELLVYNHLALSGLAYGRELEEHLVLELATIVKSREILDMLYLLTVLDIRHVGYKTWTPWRAQLLETAYDRVTKALSPIKKDARQTSEEIGINSPGYYLDILPEDRLKHAQWLENLHEGDFLCELEPFIGFDRISVLSFDKIGLFADITGCISSEGFNILSAHVYSTSAGKILDIFHVEKDGITTLPSQDRIENIKKKWSLITSAKTSTQKLLDERLRMYPPKKSRGIPKQPSVRFDNEISKSFSVLDIEAQDCFGLLFRIAQTLSSHTVNIVSARLSTRIDRAVDTFYVTNNAGNKISDTVIIAAMTNDIMNALSAE